MLAMVVNDDDGNRIPPRCSQVHRRNAARSKLAPTGHYMSLHIDSAKVL